MRQSACDNAPQSSLANVYATQGIGEAQQVEKPQDNRNDNNNIQDACDLGIHYAVFFCTD